MTPDAERLAAIRAMEMERPIKKCDNGLCDRIISAGSMYCCPACDLADRGKYEIHESGPLGHAESCNDLWRFRRTDPVVRLRIARFVKHFLPPTPDRPRGEDG